MSFRLLMIKL